jgi:hypothetical protein
MLKKSYPYYLANEAVAANTDLEVTDKFSGEVAMRVALADAHAISPCMSFTTGRLSSYVSLIFRQTYKRAYSCSGFLIRCRESRRR